MQMMSYIREHIYIVVLLVLFGIFYFYHLDYTTLSSWDEGWYATISRTMIQSGDYMHMTWLGKPFYDHPPMGMWLVALSYKAFGISEFATRFPSALLGLGAVLLTYVLGRDLFKSKHVGFAGALVLGTSIWFIARARSGNLDAPFCFFYLATLYTAFKAHVQPRWFLATGLFFGCLIMTKTLIGISALPLILYISFPRWTHPRSIGYFIGGVLIWCGVVLPWYILHAQRYPEFIHHHFTTIGTRERHLNDYFHFGPAKQVLFYVHMGIGSWYKLWVVALAWLVGRLLFVKKYHREIVLLLLWNGGILFPFLSSEQSQLWHLIPVYIPVALVTSYAVWEGLMWISTWPHMQMKQSTYMGIFVLIFILIASKNIFNNYKELIPQYRYESERVLISREVQKYDQKVYLDDDFLPEAIFYAGRDITPISAAAQDDPAFKNTLRGQFQTDEKDFIVITRAWATNSLDDAHIPYVVLSQNKEFKIIARPHNEE